MQCASVAGIWNPASDLFVLVHTTWVHFARNGLSMRFKNKQVTRVPSNEDVYYTCTQCRKWFPSKCAYKEHKLSHRKRVCLDCKRGGLKFECASKREMKKHTEEHHANSGFSCETCDLVMVSRGELLNHFATAHARAMEDREILFSNDTELVAWKRKLKFNEDYHMQVFNEKKDGSVMKKFVCTRGKDGSNCTAMYRSWLFKDGQVQVHCMLVHTGHEDVVKDECDMPRPSSRMQNVIVLSDSEEEVTLMVDRVQLDEKKEDNRQVESACSVHDTTVVEKMEEEHSETVVDDEYYSDSTSEEERETPFYVKRARLIKRHRHFPQNVTEWSELLHVTQQTSY